MRGQGKKPTSRWIGFKVKTSDNRPYGEVVDVYEFGAGEVFDIQKPNGKIEMLPLNDTFLKVSEDESCFIVQAFEFSEAKPE